MTKTVSYFCGAAVLNKSKKIGLTLNLSIIVLDSSVVYNTKRNCADNVDGCVVHESSK